MKSLLLIFLLSFSFLLHAGEEENNRLISAIRISDVERAQSALNAGADVNFQIRSRSSSVIEWVSPLHEAIRIGNPVMIYMLIEHGADIYSIDSHKQSALHAAIIWPQPQLVEFLVLEKGVSVDIRSGQELTPLELLALNPKITQNREYDWEAVRTLLRLGADVNALPSYTIMIENTEQVFRPATLFHLATHVGNLPFLDFLIKETNAEIDATDKHGLTPLHYTVFISDPDIAIETARKLLKAGAKRSAKGTIYVPYRYSWIAHKKKVTPSETAVLFVGKGKLANYLKYYSLVRWCY